MKQAFLILIVVCNFPIFLSGQILDFEYDKNIVINYAILAMEEFNAHNSNIKRDFRRDYDIKNAFTWCRIIEDCNQKNQNVILVAFDKLDGNGSAIIYMTYSKDNYLDTFLERAYTIESAKSSIEAFKKHNLSDFLFGCGL